MKIKNGKLIVKEDESSIDVEYIGVKGTKKNYKLKPSPKNFGLSLNKSENRR